MAVPININYATTIDHTRHNRVQNVTNNFILNSALYIPVLIEKISLFHINVNVYNQATALKSWWPKHKAVAKIPNTKNGWAEAWYFTSFSIGSGSKRVAWK